MEFLPIAVRITDHNILLVGGGKEAAHKGAILSRFTDKVTVIAPQFTDELRRLPFHFIERPFEDTDLEGAQLVFICTGSLGLNHHVKAVADRQGVLASVCDDPAWCDFVSPAISHQPDDNLTIAVGSDAKDVHRAIRVRNRINQLVSNHTLDIE